MLIWYVPVSCSKDIKKFTYQATLKDKKDFMFYFPSL